MKRLRLASAVALVVLGSTGCSGAGLTQLYRDPNYRSKPIARIFIVSAIPKEANPAQFENTLAAALTAKGFQAADAASAFPPGPLDKRQVKRYVEDNGVDLLVMIRLTTEKAAPVVATTTVAQSSGWYGGYGGAVATSSQVVAQGTDVTARIEAFDVRTDPDTLIWSGQSNTVDIQGAAQSLANELVKQLETAKILVK